MGKAENIGVRYLFTWGVMEIGEKTYEFEGRRVIVVKGAAWRKSWKSENGLKIFHGRVKMDVFLSKKFPIKQ